MDNLNYPEIDQLKERDIQELQDFELAILAVNLKDDEHEKWKWILKERLKRHDRAMKQQEIDRLLEKEKSVPYTPCKPVIDFPKLEAPFVRKTINKRHVVIPEINPGYEWVFEDPCVTAVDKLDGTNICVIFDHGKLLHIDNRDTRIVKNCSVELDLHSNQHRMIQGVLEALSREWITEEMLIKNNGRLYGELIGPDINQNIHQVDRPMFVPFDYLQSKCYWKSWFGNKYPKDFETISNWFKELPSLFNQRLNKTGYAEGLIFVNKDGRMAKLRRDMFDWYTGERHGA